MKNTHTDYAALARAIKQSLSVTEYCNTVLGMNVTEGVRCVPTYRNGYNPTEFISYGDSYTDWGFPGGKRIHCDVIQLCADARHNGDRAAAIYELARSHINAERLSVIMNDPVTYDQHMKSLESKILYWHAQLRKEDREYLHSRRITDETIERLKIGYCAMTKRLITPYLHNGRFVYYSGRDVTGRWKTAPKGTCAKYTKMKISHFYVENIPWGLHTLEPEHRALFPSSIQASDGSVINFSDLLCILEGQVDAMSFEQEGFQVCSPIGGYFNEMQMPYFLSICREIGKAFICFDNDGAGTGFQLKMARQLFENNIPFVSCIVPKKIPGMPPVCTGQALVTQGSNIVNGINTRFTQSVHVGDIFDINDGKIYVIDKIIDDNNLLLKNAYEGQTNAKHFEITRYIKDVSDYYTAGGNLADLVANAEEGLISIGRIIGSDYRALRDFLKECSKRVPVSSLKALLDSCTGINASIKSSLLKEATRIPNDNDILNEIIGYTDEDGKKHKGKYQLKYVENDSFYEYAHGCWVRRRDSEIKEYIRKLLGQYQRSDRITGAFNLLKLACNVPLSNINLSNYFNQQPVVNFMNGILDLNADDDNIRELHPHNPDYNSSLQVPYMYNRDAKCPKILKFLHEVLWYKNEEITRQKILLLQEYLAYPLYTDNHIHKMLFMLGNGRNGKGTVLELLRAVYGDGCCSFVNPARFNQPFELIYLLNSMVNICFDADQDFSPSQEIIKQVVAGENVMACYKFQNYIHFKPRSKLITACNNLIYVRDLSRGFISRCLFLNFNRCYEGRENFNLLNELKEEIPGFFNWILEGYIRLRANIKNGKGFTLNEEHYETMRMFEEHTSPINIFYNEKIDSLIEFANSDNAQYQQLTTQYVFDMYKIWASAAGYDKVKRGYFTHEFKKILKQKHPEIFEKYGLSMTYKNGNGEDVFDFTCLKSSSIHDKSMIAREMEENNPETGNAGDFVPEITPANSLNQEMNTQSQPAIEQHAFSHQYNMHRTLQQQQQQQQQQQSTQQQQAKQQPPRTQHTQQQQQSTQQQQQQQAQQTTQQQSAQKRVDVTPVRMKTADEILYDVELGKYKLSSFEVKKADGQSVFVPPVKSRDDACKLFMAYLEEKRVDNLNYPSSGQTPKG